MDIFMLLGATVWIIIFLVLVGVLSIIAYFFDEIVDYFIYKTADGMARITTKELCESITNEKITQNKPVSYKCAKCNSFFCEHVND